MKFPQVIVCGPDEWAANQLAELVAENRWLLRPVAQPAAAMALAREPRPAVLLVQADPAAARLDALQLVADANRLNPDVAAVVLSDAKLGEDERAAWAAGVLDLGARLVLFPPLTRVVLEDVVGGLMAAAVRRVMGDAAAGPDPAAPATGAIDLADAGYEDE